MSKFFQLKDLEIGDTVYLRFWGKNDPVVDDYKTAVWTIHKAHPAGLCNDTCAVTDTGIWTKSSKALFERVTPKIWLDLSDEEKGQLLLAEYNNKPIQELYLGRWQDKYYPGWHDFTVYRITPTKTVELYIKHNEDFVPVATINQINNLLVKDSLCLL